MRQYIDLIQEAETAPGYPAFKSRYGEYVLAVVFADKMILNDTQSEWEDEGREFTTDAWLLDFYINELKFVQQLSGRKAYRGIRVADEWLARFQSGDVHLGVHWSTDPRIAKTFAKSGGHHDTRFEGMGGANEVMMTTTIDMSKVDVMATVAFFSTASEAEVRYIEGSSIVLDAVSWNGEVMTPSGPLPA